MARNRATTAGRVEWERLEFKKGWNPEAVRRVLGTRDLIRGTTGHGVMAHKLEKKIKDDWKSIL